jgi:drug/metabolite transporter (DMT)-like permease
MIHGSGPSPAIRGMLLMVGAAGLLNVQLVMTGKLIEAGWPDFLMLGLALALQAPCVGLWLAISQPKVPKMQECTWIFLAGIFFSGSFGLMVLALRLGIPIGDFAALNSVNVVFAAFLGRTFLKEQLHCLHFVAVLSSVAGAVLIARPGFIFGAAEGENDSSWLAYVVALCSGFCDAGIYICSRKSSDCSSGFVLLSFTLQGSVTTIACAPLVSGSMWSVLAPLMTSPYEACGWVAALTAVSAVSLIMFVFAAQWCPASLSATVDTATRMTTGYLAQALLFGASLSAFTVGGAALMFASVATMALVQTSSPKSENSAAKEVSEVALDSTVPEVAHQDEDSNEDETWSFASFVAAEFAVASPHSTALRMRRFAASNDDLPARTIGALAVVTFPTSA